MGKNVLFVLLALSIGIFGFTVGRFTDAGGFGGKTFKRAQIVPDLDDLSGKERQVAIELIGASDDLAKKFVDAVGKNADDEAKWEQALKAVKGDPVRAMMITARKAAQPPDEDEGKIWTVEPGDVPVKGPADAPITIVEFSDFQCPFCSRGYNTMKELDEKYPGKIRHFYVSKILPFHKKAPAAHAAAYAAWKQDKFWEFHDKAFDNQQQLDEPKYVEWATELGLNIEQFKKDMAVTNYEEEFARMEKLSNDLGVRGTPTFFINGRKVRGAKPTPEFVSIIDELLKEKQG
ncbi:thioredoxin domain-containing protein [bacterium]|nr:thioredoxin domain-containing protein [bacterium]